MTLRSPRSILQAAMVLLATSACAAHAVPPSGDAFSSGLLASSAGASRSRPDDTTSILKKLTKDVVIGSTVDSSNGDQGPRALSVVVCHCKHGVLKPGQLVVCNFEDSAGNAGNGTTIEALNPTPGSVPARFVQSDSIKGCDGAAINPEAGFVYGAGLTSGAIAEISKQGQVERIYRNKTDAEPFSDTAAKPKQNFSPVYIFAGTTASGGIVSISVGFYGNGRATQVAEGFGVSDGSQGELAPSGLQYDQSLDTLYIVDGVTNTVVAFSNASKLLAKDEIVVGASGKTFKCKYPKTTCGRLVYSGSPLDAPLASTLLPNGNLIVANTQGTANTLVELTPKGEVLDTKVVDGSSTQGIFGLAASGTNDSNTVLFFSDANSNTVQELER
jgi:hypothetical protein